VSHTASRYDAVVIGGGHNGLAAAAYLARAGRSCLLLERRPDLGGAVSSDRVFPGVDARLSRYAYLVSLLPQQIVRELELDVRLRPRRVASYTPDPSTRAEQGILIGADGTLSPASSAPRADAELAIRWRTLRQILAGVARSVFPTLLEPLRTREQMKRLVGPEAWELCFERPIGDGLARLLGDEDLLTGVALTDGLIGTFASAADELLPQNRCFLYHVIGRCSGDWLVPVGGMGALSAELARAARDAGATLLTGAEALSIEPAGAAGAKVSYADAGGRREAVAGHVLVNAAPAVLAELLGREPPTPPEGSQLKVNMMLARLPRLKDRRVAVADAFAGTLHVNESAAQLQAAFEQAAAGNIPDPAPCEAYCHSLTDPSILGRELRSRGAHALTVFGLHMPARLFRQNPDEARAAALGAVLRSLDSTLAEPIEDCVLRAPDGAACIEARTPLDIEDELAMPGGHIFHRDLQWPFAERDEEVGGWGVESEHEPVLLCGAGARRGGGVSCIPARNAAMAVLARDRPRSG
jgi:phytoene dehydrogenase-like protein